MRMKRGGKASAIREYISQNPSATAKDVVDALAAQRIKVTTTQVYGLRSAKPKVKSNLNGYESLLQAKKMAEAMGGVDKAKAALDILSKLIG